MKFSHLYAAFLPIMMFSSQAHALPASAQDSFRQLQQCVRQQNLASGRTIVTASSVPLYDRFTSYGLVKCLPADATYVSETPSGNYHIIRASTNANGQPRVMRLAFVNEEDQWKLDVPQSLHIAMGDNWQKQIDATEQIFLLLRQQLGAQLNCDTVKGLVQK